MSEPGAGPPGAATMTDVRGGDGGGERADPALGRAIGGGRYRIERLLGEGAVGRVYAATQLSLGREVALKLLHPRHAADATQVRRFTREARAATRLNSRHIVKVLDFGVDDATGAPWLALELLRGDTLEAWLGRVGPLPPRRAAAVAAQIARALVDAARAGIVHRDLKPANVMRVETGDGAELFAVTDFGVAKDLLASEPAGLTGEGVAVGTPAYMAPEQVTGDRVDARADLYALGCMLHELLTGRRPFAAEARAAVLSDQLLVAPPPLPDPLPSGERAPPELDALRRRLLAKAPADRPADAREVLDALERVARGEPPAGPVMSRPAASEEERLRRSARGKLRRWRRHKRVFLSFSAGLGLINLATMIGGEPFPWALIPLGFWGIFVMLHGLGYGSWLEDNATALAAAGVEPVRPAPKAVAAPRVPPSTSVWPALIERCHRAAAAAGVALRDVDTRSGGGGDARARLAEGLADVERIARGGVRLEAALKEAASDRAAIAAELADVEARLAATSDARLRAAYDKNRALLLARRERVEALEAEHARLRATVEGFALAADNLRLDAARVRAPHVDARSLSLDEPLRRLEAEVEVVAEVEAELARLDEDLRV